MHPESRSERQSTVDLVPPVATLRGGLSWPSKGEVCRTTARFRVADPVAVWTAGWAKAWSPEQISNRLRVDLPDDWDRARLHRG